MRLIGKIAIITIMSMLLAPINIVSAATDYNTPTTSLSDIDKTSPCEVTADIHYSYYVSMPAALTLEPFDTATYNKQDWPWVSSTLNIIQNSVRNEILEKCYVCPYKVKAKTTSAGLAGKYIYISNDCSESFGGIYVGFPPVYDDAGNIVEWLSDCCAVSCFALHGDNIVLENVEDGSTDDASFDIWQRAQQFGAEQQWSGSRLYVEKVGSDKWSNIEGIVVATIQRSGVYKGNFEFEYGLCDEAWIY